EVSLPTTSGVLLVNELVLENINVTGLSEFQADEMRPDTSGGAGTYGIAFDLTFSLHARADNAKFDFLIGDMIPLYGNGTLQLNIDGLRLNGIITANTSAPVLFLQAINVDIAIEKTRFDISNIMHMEGTKYAEIFNNVMSETTPQILNFSVESLKDDIIEQLKNTVNDFLEEKNATLSDLLACIGLGSGNCFFN
ncbi:hypothetical protein L9F63_017611, partial [Diploptera punctata]